MTNAEKFTTSDERTLAFDVYCRKICTNESGYCNHAACAFAWLNLEAEEEKPLPCPFCGGEVKVLYAYHGLDDSYVSCNDCTYCSGHFSDSVHAVSKHNIFARAVMEASEKEVSND